MIALEETPEGAVIHARHLMLPPQPAEDAFTDSAMGPAAWLWQTGALPSPRPGCVRAAGWASRAKDGSR